MMTECQKEKKDFVRSRLVSLLLGIDRDIAWAEYSVDKEEFVKVTWKNGYSKLICVTADSLKALTMDVLRRI